MKLGADVTAVIVGGASGLGAATVRRLSQSRVHCAIFDRDAARGEALAESVGGSFFACDVTAGASVEAAFDALKAARGPARILVNCAGTGAAVKVASRSRETGEIRGHPIELFEKILQINLVGSFRTMVRFATDCLTLDPTEPDGERGVVINTSSIAAQDGQIGQVAYAASKGGVIGMMLPAARDLGREGIRVVTILPGFFETPLTGHAPKEAQEALIGHQIFPRRGGRPEEYALLAEQICLNPMFNAEAIRLDGGARFPPR